MVNLSPIWTEENQIAQRPVFNKVGIPPECYGAALSGHTVATGEPAGALVHAENRPFTPADTSLWTRTLNCAPVTYQIWCTVSCVCPTNKHVRNAYGHTPTPSLGNSMASIHVPRRASLAFPPLVASCQR